MFKLASDPTFTHVVRVQVPVDGGHATETLRVTYRVIGTEALERYELNTSEGTREFLRATIVRLDDIVDETGAPVPYSDAVRDRVIDLPYARVAIVRGYFDGVARGLQGN
jgi:hypothetical protein